MELSIEGKVVVVTGAARGIGRAIAERFAEEGAVTVALDRAPVAEWGGENVRTAVCDVTDLAAVTALFDDVVARHGRLDVLVNNAGINAEGALETIDPALWRAAFAVNVDGTFHTCRAAAPHMKRQHFGRMINAASFAAIVPSVGAAAYAASKAAVVSLTRVLASELGPWGVTVNAYAPGMIPTDMNGFADLIGAEREGRLDQLSIRRWGDAADVADLLCFLASERSGYITGALLDVSGGKLATQSPGVAHRGD